MGIFNTESRLLLGKREATAGTAETLASSDGDVRVRSVELSTLQVEFDDESSKYLTGDHTGDESIAGVARGVIDFTIKMAMGEMTFATSGATTSTPKLPYSKYLESAGFTVSAVPATSYGSNTGYWELYPEKEADELTSTIALYDIETGATGVGIEYKLAGCVGGSFKLGVESTGKPFMGSFSMQGKVSDVANVAHANIPTFDDDAVLSTLADPMLNTIVRITEVNQDGSTKVGSTAYNMCLSSFEIDSGLTTAEIMCQSDAYGIKNNVITKRSPRISCSPQLSSLNDFNFWTSMTGMKVYKFEVIAYKDVAKTIPVLSVIAPRCQLIQANGSDDNGFRRLDAIFKPMRNLQGATARDKQHDYKIRIYGVNTLL